MKESPKATIEFKLPGGRVVKMHEPNGHDERAASEAARLGGTPNDYDWELLSRCTISVDGDTIDRTSITPEKFRDAFTSREFSELRRVFMASFYAVTEKEQKSVDDSKSVSL